MFGRRDTRGKDFLLGAMIGSTLGALSAAAVTSKKGQKLQNQMMHKYREFEDMVQGYANKQQRKAKRAVKKLVKGAKKQARKRRRR